MVSAMKWRLVQEEAGTEDGWMDKLSGLTFDSRLFLATDGSCVFMNVTGNCQHLGLDIPSVWNRLSRQMTLASLKVLAVNPTHPRCAAGK